MIEAAQDARPLLQLVDGDVFAGNRVGPQTHGRNALQGFGGEVGNQRRVLRAELEKVPLRRRQHQPKRLGRVRDVARCPNLQPHLSGVVLRTEDGAPGGHRRIHRAVPREPEGLRQERNHLHDVERR